jgi:hypothetical protein
MRWRESFLGGLQELQSSLRRFPVALALGAVGSAFGVVLARGAMQGGPYEPRIVAALLACWLGIALSMAMTLMGEALRLQSRVRGLLQAASLVLVALAYWRLHAAASPESAEIFFLVLLWFVAVHALIALAPRFAGRDTAAFRAFNLAAFQRALAAVALSGILFGGLCGALAAIDGLLGVDVPDWLYFALWFVTAGVFNTAYLSGGFPRPDAAIPEKTPAFVLGLTRFILFPLSVVYLLILYAYAARILWMRQWPEGTVSAVILAFAAIGFLTQLLLEGSPETGRGGRLYVRSFHALLAPLVVMLFGAIWVRHREYGLTEPRALVWLAALWLAGMILLFLLRRRTRVEVIPAALGAVTLLASLGPWSIFDLSLNSQWSRVKTHLENAGRLREGVLVRGDGVAVAEQDGEEIREILRYLDNHQALDGLRSWESRSGTECADCITFGEDSLSARWVIEKLGLPDAPERSAGFTFNAKTAAAHDLRGYSTLLRFDMSRRSTGSEYSVATDAGVASYELKLRKNNLVVLRGGKPFESIPLGALVDRLLKAGGAEAWMFDMSPDTLRVIHESPRGRFVLYASHVMLEHPKSSTDWEASSLQGILLMGPPRPGR